MGHFKSVANQLAADAKVSGNLARCFSNEHKFSERSERNKGRSARGVGRFLIRFLIIARDCTAALTCANDRQAIWSMPEKDVAYLLHQCRMLALAPMRWIQNDDFPTVGKHSRTSAAGPFCGCRPQKMFANLSRQSLDLIKIHHEQISKTSKSKRVERYVCSSTREIAQAKSL